MERRRTEAALYRGVTEETKIWVETFSEMIGIPSYSRLRDMAKEYHRSIETRLIKESRIKRNEIPRGATFLHDKMVNYLRFNGRRIGGTPLTMVEKFRGEATFLECYKQVNEEFLKRIEGAYPGRTRLLDACSRQRHSRVLYLRPEDIYEDLRR